MIYEMGSTGLKPIGAHANDTRNKLEPGTVLQLNGYDDPRYCVLKNLGVNPKFPDHGATYLVANEACEQSRKQAYTLKHIGEKKDGRIQLYITDERLKPDKVLELWEKSEAKRKDGEEKRRAFEAGQKEKEARGRMLCKKHIPCEAQALLVAEYHKNESDIQSDYFAHRTTKMVVLAWSKHKRDLFSEMRKAANKIPETRHLGPNMGHFEARIRIGQDFQSNGAYYHKGQYSPWHRERIEEKGTIRVFKTREAAEHWALQQGALKDIFFENRPISFEWAIEEEKIEHRQKYSMGAGYFLKDGGRHCTGWSICKIKKYGENWPAGICVSMAERCVF